MGDFPNPIDYIVLTAGTLAMLTAFWLLWTHRHSEQFLCRCGHKEIEHTHGRTCRVCREPHVCHQYDPVVV